MLNGSSDLITPAKERKLKEEETRCQVQQATRPIIMAGVFDKTRIWKGCRHAAATGKLAAGRRRERPESRVCFNMLGLRERPACSSLQLKPKNQLSSVRGEDRGVWDPGTEKSRLANKQTN